MNGYLDLVYDRKGRCLLLDLSVCHIAMGKDETIGKEVIYVAKDEEFMFSLAEFENKAQSVKAIEEIFDNLVPHSANVLRYPLP